MSDWYTRLMDYFPEKEMKSKEHFDILLQEKKGAYQLEESRDHVLLYSENSNYVFIDYILVFGKRRGKGIGSIVLDQLKEKGKAIILEVEPVNLMDPDSEKRVRFYEKNDFTKMESIRYERIHAVTNELNKMDVFAWTPVPVSEEWVCDQMKDVYKQVHTYKYEEMYGCQPQPVSEVLRLGELTYSRV